MARVVDPRTDKSSVFAVCKDASGLCSCYVCSQAFRTGEKADTVHISRDGKAFHPACYKAEYPLAAVVESVIDLEVGGFEDCSGDPDVLTEKHRIVEMFSDAISFLDIARECEYQVVPVFCRGGPRDGVRVMMMVSEKTEKDIGSFDTRKRNIFRESLDLLPAVYAPSPRHSLRCHLVVPAQPGDEETFGGESEWTSKCGRVTATLYKRTQTGASRAAMRDRYELFARCGAKRVCGTMCRETGDGRVLVAEAPECVWHVTTNPSKFQPDDLKRIKELYGDEEMSKESREIMRAVVTGFPDEVYPFKGRHVFQFDQVASCKEDLDSNFYALGCTRSDVDAIDTVAFPATTRSPGERLFLLCPPETVYPVIPVDFEAGYWASTKDAYTTSYVQCDSIESECLGLPSVDGNERVEWTLERAAPDDDCSFVIGTPEEEEEEEEEIESDV